MDFIPLEPEANTTLTPEVASGPEIFLQPQKSSGYKYLTIKKARMLPLMTVFYNDPSIKLPRRSDRREGGFVLAFGLQI